jgi:hypothetical protein
MNLSRSARKKDMAHYTLIARINAGDGKFPFVNVQFSKNHRPIPIEGANLLPAPEQRRLGTAPSSRIFVSRKLKLPDTLLTMNGLRVNCGSREFPGQVERAISPLFPKYWLVCTQGSIFHNRQTEL